MMPFPDKKYDIIYADPPWQYGNEMNQYGDNLSSASRHYYTMTMEELYQLPISQLSGVNSLLFLWSSSPHLDIGIRLGSRWGFDYKTVAFVWYKQNNNPGHYTMSECELCLVFKRGCIPQPRGKRNIRQFLSCKRGTHSDKPDEVRHRITEMFPTQSKIELFARVNDRLFPPMEGWDYWGNEA